jgi:acetolactate synthase I/II/III large subunit
MTTTNLPSLSGGQLVVASLRAHGVEMAFSVAGESYLEVLDALYDAPEIRLVTCRQEGGAAFMAEAYGKLTHKPGVLLVTRGPGACNASIGVHTAFQDSTPMVVLVGQVARHQLDREAFQEVDFRKMYAPLAKWVAQIDLAERVPELVSQAFQAATSGRPGPVVLALPEDMLRDRREAAPPAHRYRPVRAHPGADDLAEMRRMLAAAERPLMLVGGGGWTDAACDNIAGFAAANELPVCCSFRRQDILDNRLPNFVGDLGTGAAPALVERFEAADLVLAVGARIGEITSQSYSLLGVPDPGKTLIHVHPAAEEPGRVFRPDLAIQSGVPEFAAAAARLPPVETRRWTQWLAAARRDYEAGLLPSPAASGGSLDLGEVMTWLRRRLPDDAIVTSDAGNFSGWPNRFLSYRRPGRQLGPTSGAMGYGVPAAVAAKLVHPGRLVVGDGGFLMTGHELATAQAEGVGPVILLFNNAMYGTIRMHQERRFPGRVVGTALKNPDFAALARAYGAFGAAVARTEDFAPAFEEAAADKGGGVIELRMDPETITTRTTLSALRRQAEAQRG